MLFFNILLLSASLECGVLQGSAFNYNAMNPECYRFNDIAFYTNLHADVDYKGIYLGGGMICYLTPESITNYVPFQMTYIFETGYKNDVFQLGFEHSCFHPIQPYATIIGTEIKPVYEGGYNKIFVRISTR